MKRRPYRWSFPHFTTVKYIFFWRIWKIFSGSYFWSACPGVSEWCALYSSAMSTVSCAIPWLHCRSLVDQDCPTPCRHAGTALPHPWSGSCKHGPAIQGVAQKTASLHSSWQRTFQTCTVNMTALLRTLMQNAWLIIYWILCCVPYSV